MSKFPTSHAIPVDFETVETVNNDGVKKQIHMGLQPIQPPRCKFCGDDAKNTLRVQVRNDNEHRPRFAQLHLCYDCTLQLAHTFGA